MITEKDFPDTFEHEGVTLTLESVDPIIAEGFVGLRGRYLASNGRRASVGFEPVDAMTPEVILKSLVNMAKKVAGSL